jgi:hypothetical protein
MTTFGALVESRAIPDGDFIAIAIGVAMVAFAAVLARRSVRGWSSGVMITPTKVINRTPWGSESFPIDDVKRFVPEAIPVGRAPHPVPGVVLELHDGSAAPIWALCKEGFVWNTDRNVDAWRDTTDALNRMLDTVQHDRVTTAGTR